MAEQTPLERLEAAGVTFVSKDGRFGAAAPTEAAKTALKSLSVEERADLKSAWCACEWQTYLAERPLPVHDPRPDIVSDHQEWTALLHLAYAEERELWGALHGLRSMGARLVPLQGRLTLTPGERLPARGQMLEQGLSREEYAQARAQWLVPHTALLGALLTRVGRARR